MRYSKPERKQTHTLSLIATLTGLAICGLIRVVAKQHQMKLCMVGATAAVEDGACVCLGEVGMALPQGSTPTQEGFG